MKRDMDLIRRIALALRDNDGAISGIEAVDALVFSEHVRLMKEKGLIEGVATTSINGPIPGAIASRLTWDGQEFADQIAEESVWKTAKEKVIVPGASWSFQLLREVIADILRKNAGL